MAILESYPLIPREVLFGNPEKTQARLSPDGAMLAFLSPVNKVLNVWDGPAGSPDAAQPVTHDTKRGIRIYFWAFTGHHILYLQDKGGDENWRVYSVDLKTGETMDLTPFDNVHAEIQQVSHLFPSEILVSLNKRVPQFLDIYRLNIETGELKLIQQNDGFMGFMTDDQYHVRFALLSTPDGGTEVQKPGPDGKWESFFRIGIEDSLSTYLIELNQSGDKVYMADSRGRNTSAVVELDLQNGTQVVLAEDPHSDAAGGMIHPVKKRMEAVSFNYDRVH